MKKLLISAAALALSVAISATTTYAADLTLHGSTTVTANVFDPYKAKLEKTTGLSLRVVGNGSSRGVIGLIENQADIGMISSTVDSMKSKMADVQWDKINAYDVGTAHIAFIVHKSNPLDKLTLAQITDILSGKITNWSEVGGFNKPIVIISEYSGGGMRSTVEKRLLNKESLKGKVKGLPNGPQVVKVSSQLPNALGIANGAIANDSVKELETDKEISQPLILLTRGEASTEAQTLIDAIRELGIK